MKEIILNEEIKRDIKSLYLSGLSGKNIAPILKLSETVVYKELRKQNITRPPDSEKESVFNKKIKEIEGFFMRNTLTRTANHFGCSKVFLRRILRKANIKKPVVQIDKDLVIQLYKNKQSVEKIAKKLKTTPWKIKSILIKNNIAIRSTKDYRPYHLNDSFFENIDTHEKASILGFLFADGYNNEKEGKIRIGLHKKDIDYLYIINDIIQPDKKRPISFTHSPKFKNIKDQNRKNRNIACLSIYCKKISVDLSKLGCKQAKSLTARFPDLNSIFMPSFALGYFDGDGSISFYQDKEKGYKRNYQVNLCVSDNFGMKIKEILEKNLSIHTCLIKKGKISSISISGNNQVRKFMDWIYKDSPVKLKRKYAIYLEMVDYLDKYKKPPLNRAVFSPNLRASAWES